MRKINNILQNLIFRLFSIVILFTSLCIFLSLVSFNLSDESFNNISTNEEVGNLLGIYGAYFSDFMFQIIGISSFFLCIILFILSIQLFKNLCIRNILFKLTYIPFFILSSSAFCSTIKRPLWWPFKTLGGVNGEFITNILEFIPIFGVNFIFLLISIILFSLILEISISDWKYFFRYFIHCIKIIPKIFFDLILKFFYLLFLKNKNIGRKDSKKNKINYKKNRTIDTIRDMNLSSDQKAYLLPSVNLLKSTKIQNLNKNLSSSLKEQSKFLIKVLSDFGVYGKILSKKVGPVVTLYEFDPVAGTKSSRVIGLADDIARSMSAVSARISVIPGKTTIGVEIPNKEREIIYLSQLIKSDEYKYNQCFLPIILGKDIKGDPILVDLSKMPHLLIAGTTGSGKSVGINAIILSLLYKMKPDECKFVMIDPKMLELSVYNGIPHLLTPVVTDPKKAIVALKWVINEMEERYKLMSYVNVRNISGYNKKMEKYIKFNKRFIKKSQVGFEKETGKPIFENKEIVPKKVPFIVVVVDEMADLMLVAGKEIEVSVQRLAQMARAAGIHIIMATQRPSVDVITGVIKANFPTRISFQVTSRIDSRTILGISGAEQLLGQGDMIYMSSGGKLMRLHGPFCSDEEVENVVDFLKNQVTDNNDKKDEIFNFDNKNSSIYNEGESSLTKDDDLYNQAIEVIKKDKKISISYIQRKLRIGYNRSASLIERMEKENIITPPNKSGKRELIDN